MCDYVFRGRHAWFVALLLAFSVATPAVGAEAESPAPAAGEPLAVAPALDVRFTRPPEEVDLPPLPNNPVETLVTEVNLHSTSLGFPVDPRLAISNAGMSNEFAGRVALLMQAVNACPERSPDLDPNAPQDVTPEQLECAKAVNDAAAGVSRTQEPVPCLRDVDIWPSQYIDCDGSNDRYVHDYSVLIDTGGNDVYDNNAGGNLLDNKRGPEGSAAPIKADAIGCEHAQTLPQAPATVPPPQDCIADRQTVLLDQKGDDTYGVFKQPRKVDPTPFPEPFKRRVDGDCTNDKVIRRVVTQGAGFQGNALLMDKRGNDHYNAKTASQGAGHIGGIGMLRDLGGGDDDYLSIRSSQGFGLVAGANGFGLLQEDGGNDRYHSYMPSAIDPDRWLNEAGSGGVVDDLNNCDSIPRMMQGTSIGFGAQGGLGYLLDENGRDIYEGAPRIGQKFLGPVAFLHSSQGFGCDGGIGVLEDRGGDDDTYLRGPKNRTDGKSISEPEVECGFFPAPGEGIFIDDGPSGSDCDGKDGKRGKKGKRNGNGSGNGAGNGERECRR